MLKLAIPNKGALSEDAVRLLGEAGYKCSRSGRELVVSDRVNDIDFVFLRPRDIALYVGDGVLDLGITGARPEGGQRRRRHRALSAPASAVRASASRIRRSRG